MVITDIHDSIHFKMNGYEPKDKTMNQTSYYEIINIKIDKQSTWSYTHTPYILASFAFLLSH